MDSHGSSLLDLKSAAAEFGRRLSVKKLPPVALKTCKMPVIAHVELSGVETRHFWVVTQVYANDQIRVLDGTTSAVSVITIAEFGERSTGYRIVPVSGLDVIASRLPPVLAGLVIVVLTATIFLRLRFRRFRGERCT